MVKVCPSHGLVAKFDWIFLRMSSPFLYIFPMDDPMDDLYKQKFLLKKTLQTLKHQLPTLDEQVLWLTTILVGFIIEHK